MQLQPMIKLLVVGASVISFGVAGCAQKREQVQAQSLPSQSTVKLSSASSDAQALVKLGPRVAGTPVMQKASNYIIEAYRKAGYVTEVQTFTYAKFADLGSTLTVDGKTIKGRALNGSPPLKRAAPLVVVPNVGRTADFALVDVKGAIALVRRGEIRFLEKAQNAAAAGAVGLVIVNTDAGNFTGTLGGEVKIPVLALAGKLGEPLFNRQQPYQASIAVNTRRLQIVGRNVIAHLPGVTKPRVLLGAHYDSVVDSPGANDNASGTAVVLAIARTADTTLARQAWFVAFDGEEDGLHGSKAFVKNAQPEFLQGLKGMLNFDMVGVNQRLLVGGTKSLTALAQTVDPEVSTFGGSSGSDHASFAAANVPVVFFYRGQEPNYHTPNDRKIDPQLLDETTQIGLNLVKKLLTS